MIAVFKKIVPGIRAISDFSSSVSAIGCGTPGARFEGTGSEYAGGGFDGLEEDRACTDFQREEKDVLDGWVADELARGRVVGGRFSGLVYSGIVAGTSVVCVEMPPLVAVEGREMRSGVMWEAAPRLLTCELRRVNACRRLTVRDRRGSATGVGSGRNTGIETSASEPSVWKTVGHICISSGIRFGDSPTVKLYSDCAVGDAGAVL